MGSVMVDVYLFSHAIWHTALVLHVLNFFYLYSGANIE